MQITPGNPGSPVANWLIEYARSYWPSRWAAVTWFRWSCEPVAVATRRGRPSPVWC